MLNDKITLKDLSVFSASGNNVFQLIDRATTQSGKAVLSKMLHQPPPDFQALKATQEVIQFWTQNEAAWPSVISNGTLVMLEKFFESADNAVSQPSRLNFLFGPLLQKLLNRTEYFFTQFSVSHIADFVKGCQQLTALLQQPELPALLRSELEYMDKELQHRLTKEVMMVQKNTPYKDLSIISFKVRREMKQTILRLIYHYSRLDAWQSLAKATVEHQWVFPELLPPHPICFESEGLYHPLLEQPVAYATHFNDHQNFLLLTGANMSGKTTFMRAVGLGALLAHMGMGVPAKAMKISFLQGVITNMHVEDNLIRGESYFFAEVKRMKDTAQRLVSDAPHLVLMDELFKGTNVHDAYECTRAVVEGLLEKPEHLMILSSHLYEVAQHFSNRKEILFAYFVTQMAEDNSYHFTYQLKQGISNDRIGYRILQNEGVIDLLKRRK